MFYELPEDVDPSELFQLLASSSADLAGLYHYASIVGSGLLLLVSAVLLAASLAGYTLFLLYMRTKPGSSSRMLNVLLANMVAISMCENILMFIQVEFNYYFITFLKFLKHKHRSLRAQSSKVRAYCQYSNV